MYICITFISLFLASFLYNINGNQADIFFGKTSNYMADYYNIAIHSSE